MATLLTALLYITSALGTVAGIATALSTMIDPLSPLGKWVAWVASCPIGHSPKALAAKESK